MPGRHRYSWGLRARPCCEPKNIGFQARNGRWLRTFPFDPISSAAVSLGVQKLGGHAMIDHIELKQERSFLSADNDLVAAMKFKWPGPNGTTIVRDAPRRTYAMNRPKPQDLFYVAKTDAVTRRFPLVGYACLCLLRALLFALRACAT